MRKRVGIIFSSLVLLMAFSMITPAATFRQVQILSKGASSYTKPYSQYTTVTYAVKIKNPNKDYAIRFPSIDVTLYGSGGRIVDTDSMSAWFIPANETMYLTGETLVEKSRGSVSRVTFNVEQKNEYSFEKQNNYKHIRLSKYKISNVEFLITSLSSLSIDVVITLIPISYSLAETFMLSKYKDKSNGLFL